MAGRLLKTQIIIKSFLTDHYTKLLEENKTICRPKSTLKILTAETTSFVAWESVDFLRNPKRNTHSYLLQVSFSKPVKVQIIKVTKDGCIVTSIREEFNTKNKCWRMEHCRQVWSLRTITLAGMTLELILKAMIKVKCPLIVIRKYL